MRVQILELPYNPDEAERPYAVIISEMPEGTSAEGLQGIKDGADWVLCTTEKVELGPELSFSGKWITSPAPSSQVADWIVQQAQVGIIDEPYGRTL